MELHVATVFESIADAVPEATAVVQGGIRRSWREFDDIAARLAGSFVAAGLGPGSKVAEYLFNSPEYLEVYTAALKMRAIPVNINYRYLDDELLYLLDNSDAEVLVFHSSLGDRVARVSGRATKLKLLVEVDDGGEHLDGAARYAELLEGSTAAPRVARDAEDITMVYTGGTTGMPKGVMTPVGPGVEVLMQTTPPLVGLAPLTDPAEIAPLVSQLADEGRLLSSLPACPLMHATGLSIGALPAMMFGGAVVLLEDRGLNADELWSTIEREHVNALTIVGDAFSRPLLRELDEGRARDLSSLLIMCSSGAMFSAEIKAGLLRHLPQLMIIDFIAATEGTMGMAIAAKDAPPVTGRFLPSPGVKVFNEHDEEIAPGSGGTGVVAIPGAIPDGYYKDDVKTASTFREIDGVRYSVPGDWASVEADGSITLLGRGSQCINTGGEKVYPEEVEEAVKRHPAVADCLVFGLADERFGQRVVAVASLEDGATASAEEVLADLRTRLSAYKVPRQLALVEDAPRSPSGKADYPKARELFTLRQVAL
jgi:3-oxocholest-4-en-26-oate---CoA ligase